MNPIGICLRFGRILMRILIIILVFWSVISVVANSTGWSNDLYARILEIGRPLSMYTLCLLIIWGGCDLTVSIMEGRWKIGQTVFLMLKILIVTIIMILFRLSQYI